MPRRPCRNSTGCCPSMPSCPLRHGAAHGLPRCEGRPGAAGDGLHQRAAARRSWREYRKIMPAFEEAFCPLLPMAITHGLQLYWQKRMWPEDFARVTTLLPWIQYVGFRLSGVPVTEMSSMACQTHLMDTRSADAVHDGAGAGLGQAVPADGQGLGDDRHAEARIPRRGIPRRGRACWAGVHDFDRQFHALCVRRARPLHAGLDRHLEHQLRSLDAARRAGPGARHQHQYRCAGPHGVLQPLLRRQGVRGRGGRCSGEAAISPAWQSWWRAAPMPFRPSR